MECSSKQWEHQEIWNEANRNLEDANNVGKACTISDVECYWFQFSALQKYSTT